MTTRFKDPVSGFSHLAGFVISLFTGGLLLGATRGAADAHIAGLVFAVATSCLYLASAAYHLVIAAPEVERRLHLLDRSAIFVMIAGTSTAFYFYAYEGDTRVMMIAVIWAFALAGVVFKMLWRNAPRALYVLVYIGMGWLAVTRWQETVDGLGPVALRWLLYGGISYTAGAFIYAIKRPNFSKHFGFHELWHLFVLGGTACHYVGVYSLSTS